MPHAYIVAAWRPAATTSSPVTVSRIRGSGPAPGSPGTATPRQESITARLSSRRRRPGARSARPIVSTAARRPGSRAGRGCPIPALRIGPGGEDPGGPDPVAALKAEGRVDDGPFSHGVLPVLAG